MYLVLTGELSSVTVSQVVLVLRAQRSPGEQQRLGTVRAQKEALGKGRQETQWKPRDSRDHGERA